MDSFYQALIFLGCIGALIWTLYFLLPSKNKKKRDNSSDASDASDAKISPDADVAKPKPAPAPASSLKSYGRGWPVTIGILVAIFLIWGLPALRPSAPVPQRAIVEKAMKFPLEFVGGKGALRRHTAVGIQRGGYADFEINFPYREGKGIRYQIVFRIICKSMAKCYLQIDDRTEIFDFQYGQDPNNPDLVIFFAKTGNGRVGLPNLFHPDKVQFRLWSDDDIVVMSSQVELIYPE